MLAAASLLDTGPETRKRSARKSSIILLSTIMATITLPPKVQSLEDNFIPSNGLYGTGIHAQANGFTETEQKHVLSHQVAVTSEEPKDELSATATEPAVSEDQPLERNETSTDHKSHQPDAEIPTLPKMPSKQRPPITRAIDSTDLLGSNAPPPLIEPSCHPLEPQITEEVNSYFIEHWPFPNVKAVQKFKDAGFSRVTCCYYPKALDDRIGFGCRLLTLLFLIDGKCPIFYKCTDWD